MFIYGSSTKHVATESIEGTCPVCGSESMEIEYHRGYAHLFWIPVFPTLKYAYVQCSRCQYCAESRDLAKAIEPTTAEERTEQEKLKTLRKKTPTPWYLWIGLVLIITALGSYAGYEHFEEQARQEYITHPTAKKLLVMKFNDPTEEPFNHVVVYVDEVCGEILLAQIEDMAFNNFYGAELHAKELRKTLNDGKSIECFGEDSHIAFHTGDFFTDWTLEKVIPLD